MLLFIGRRILSGVILVFVISGVTFFLIHFAGGDIARTIVGDTATEQQVTQKATELGLDRPIIAQYIDWLANVLRGDFGTSWFTSQGVTASIVAKLPVTLSVAFGATIVSAIAGFGLGTLAAVRRGKIDRLLQLLVIAGFSLPNFWLAVVLVSFFAVQLQVFPATGFVPITQSLPGWLTSLVLPISALAIGVTAATAQQTRSALIDVMRQDYIRSLRARGLPSAVVIFKHGLRNAAPAALTVLSLQFIGLLGGAVIIERVFALPGLGSMALDATTQGDVPSIMAIVVFMVLIVVTVNLLLDVAYGWLNPKVRVS